MDQRSIERALPIIQKDMDMTLAQMNKKTNQWLAETRPYTLKATETLIWIWSDIKKRNERANYKLTNKNVIAIIAHSKLTKSDC